MSKFNADKALETARDSVSGFGFELPEDKFALTTENHKLRDRVGELEKVNAELKSKALHLGQKLYLFLGLNDDEIEFMKECGGKFEKEQGE